MGRFRAKALRRLAAAAVLLTAIAAAAGCTHVAESQVERSLNRLLPHYLGPAQSYSTHVRASSAGAVMRGRLRSIHVDGEAVQLPGNGPLIERLTLDLDDVTVDPKAKRLESIGAVRFQTQIGEADLNRFLAAHRPDSAAGLLQVTLGEGTATVLARPALLARFGVTGLTIPMTVQGRLIATGDSRLDFVPDAAHVLVLPIPSAVVQRVFRELNPVVDLSSAPLPLHIRRATLQKGSLTLEGEVPPEAVLHAVETAAP